MLVVITTPPIQYQVPLWKALALDLGLPFEVWFLCDHAVRATHDPEFGRKFAWDIGQGSLEGYAHRFLHIGIGLVPLIALAHFAVGDSSNLLASLIGNWSQQRLSLALG